MSERYIGLNVVTRTNRVGGGRWENVLLIGCYVDPFGVELQSETSSTINLLNHEDPSMMPDSRPEYILRAESKGNSVFDCCSVW